MITLTRIGIFAFTAFLVSFLLFPVIIKVLKRLQWFDLPGTHKIHSEVVPSMGGIPVLVGSSLALLMSLPLQQWISMKFFFISVALMFLIGLRDDVLALTPRQKLVSQFLPVFVLVFLDDVILYSFYDFSNGAPLPLPIAYFISLFTVVIISNAYNLIDGIDGLAGTIGVIVLCFFGSWFYVADQQFLSLIAFCFAGALSAFLLFNWQPSTIFMGDTGALTIGLILSFLAVRFINSNSALPDGHIAKFGASISTAICVLIIPIFDTLRVIIYRLTHFQSPFHADKNHIHHKFLGLGMSHAGAVRRIGGINLVFIILSLLLKDQSDVVLLPVIVVLCLVIHFFLRWRQLKPYESLTNA
ncbi:MAG: MraY family glycosyltransferase [Cytophagales bacterium]|nr:MraY family glycosyltransferase [Cytophagales bacterium]